jgi:hypothetical protein
LLGRFAKPFCGSSILPVTSKFKTPGTKTPGLFWVLRFYVLLKLNNKPQHRAQRRYVALLELLTSNPSESEEFELSLDEIAREGVRRLLVEALEQEVKDEIHRHGNSTMRAETGWS